MPCLALLCRPGVSNMVLADLGLASRQAVPALSCQQAQSCMESGALIQGHKHTALLGILARQGSTVMSEKTKRPINNPY